jgi:DNA-binding HxlR family transcriptional regulator
MNVKNVAESSRILLDQIADKWTILVLAVLCSKGGKSRFNAILREVSGLTQKTLTQCLRKLERNGLINREVLDVSPIGVEYSMTPLGHTLKGPFEAISEWTDRYLTQVERAQRRFDARTSTEKNDIVLRPAAVPMRRVARK